MRKTALTACTLLLRPIASFLLRYGISWKEFSVLSKRVFIQVATEEFGIRGRPTNASRVSILTGVNRKEVTRIRKESINSDALRDLLLSQNVRGALLTGWHTDKEFCDSKGNPLELELSGDFPNFRELHRKYCKDLSVESVLKELINNQAVEKTPEGKYKALKRYTLVDNEGDARLENFCISLSDLANTIVHNYIKRDTSDTRLTCYADDFIPVSLADDFKSYMTEKGEEFLIDIDDWLGQRSALNIPSKDDVVRVGLGVYTIYDDENIPPQ